MQSRYGLIHIPPAQSLVNEYENVVQFYLDVKEDNFWHDEFYPAWKDYRVGGLRESMLARKEATLELTLNNFEAFKKKRLEELHQQMNENVDTTTKSELEREYNLLNQSTSYKSYGQSTGNYDAFKTNIHISNASDDKKQVNWTLNHVIPTVERRYEMMQGIAFAVSNGDKLSVIQSRVQELCNSIMNGLTSYKNEQDNGTYLTQDGRDEYKDGLSFKYVRKYAQQAIGLSEAYEDAIQAMINSPVYDSMRQYYINKAKKENDLSAASYWESGNYDDLILYGKNKGFIKKPSYFTHLYRGVDHNDVDNVAIPSLQRLEKAENEYNFVSQLFNEFSTARQKNPDLIKQLQEIKMDERLIRLDMDNSRDVNIAHKTVMGLADSMVQRNAVSEGILTGTKATLSLAAFAGICYATGGLGLAGSLAVGSGLGLAEMGLDSWEVTANMQKSLEHWFDDTWINKKFSHIKNSHVIEQMKQIIPHQYQLATQAAGKLKQIPEDDFDKAIAYGLRNSGKKDHDILMIINEARDIAALPKAEQDKYITECQAACRKNLEQLEKNPNDSSLLMEQQDLAREVIKIQCAKTGNYFYYAKLGTDIIGDLTSGDREEHIKLYCGEEAGLLSEVSKAMNARISTEMEAHNRQLLVNQWKEAGRPIIQLAAEDYGFDNDEMVQLNFGDNDLEESSVHAEVTSGQSQTIENTDNEDDHDDNDIPYLQFDLDTEETADTNDNEIEDEEDDDFSLDDSDIPYLQFGLDSEESQTSSGQHTNKTLVKNSQQVNDFETSISFTNNTRNG